MRNQSWVFYCLLGCLVGLIYIMAGLVFTIAEINRETCNDERERKERERIGKQTFSEFLQERRALVLVSGKPDKQSRTFHQRLGNPRIWVLNCVVCLAVYLGQKLFRFARRIKGGKIVTLLVCPLIFSIISIFHISK